MIDVVKYYLLTIFQAIAQHCHRENLSLIGKIFYTTKAILCFLADREPKKSLTDLYTEECFYECAVLGGGSYYNGDGVSHWGETLIVGYGIFTNWWAIALQDSD